MPEPILQVQGLCVRFGSNPILRNVSFTVAPGDFLSIVGPNGAGKTTLLKCLNRIVRSESGEIRILNEDLAAFSQRELARQIGYVPQAEGRHFDFTVFEFVLMGRYPHLSPFSAVSRADKDAVWEALRTTGMESFADRMHGTLSGGERQKVFMAAALAQEARILLLDEPTTFLDPRHEAEVLSVLQRVNRDMGVTVLSVTHDINRAVLASSRILALRAGNVAFCGSAAEFMTAEVLHTVYSKDFLFTPHPVTAQPMVVPEALS